MALLAGLTVADLVLVLVRESDVVWVVSIAVAAAAAIAVAVLLAGPPAAARRTPAPPKV